MKSRVTLLGHPLHPMLIVFPLGLLSTAVIFDIIQFLNRDGPWSFIAYYLIGAGIVGGFVAAAVGLLDWLGLPEGSEARRTGLIYALANTAALVLFIVSWFLRRDTPSDPTSVALLFSVAGIAMATVGGYLGGELVFRLAVGVDPRPDAARR